MSTVYKAFDTKLQRPVAIKVLAGAVADQPGFVARFHQEARLLAALSHPHIIHIYDYGEDQGAAYMVQELLPGPALEQRIADLKQRDAKLSRDEIILVSRQIGSALDAAHAAGIIHRDVKPSNILWNAAGALVLADFGVAKALHEERLTQPGMVLGTPIYLSPEQAQGQPLTPSSDIYSLGVVLYELIAGHPPFEGATSIGVALSHVQKSPPSLRRSRPDLPLNAEAVVLRALAKQPAARFRSAGELAKALERAWPNTFSPYMAATLAMRPAMRANGAPASRVRPSPHALLPIVVVFLELLVGAVGLRTLHQPVAPADGASALSMPTFAVLDPAGIPTSVVIATPQAPPAPAELATSVPIAQPDAPVAIPVAAPVPAYSAHQAPAQPPVPAAPVSPAGNHTDAPPKPEAPKPPESAPSKPSTPKNDQPKPPKPKKQDQPKPAKPSDKGKGGAKDK